MPRALDDWINDTRRRLRDTAGSQTIWTRREIQDALSDGQREARGQFWVDAIFTSLAITSGITLYALPPYVTRIRRLERSLIGNSQGMVPNGPILSPGVMLWQEMHGWRQYAGQQTNLIQLDRNYYWGTFRIHYEADLPIFPIEDTLATSITSTAAVIPYMNTNYAVGAGGINGIGAWPVPGFAKIVPDGDIFYYSAVTATSFTGVMQGQFGTGLATLTQPFGLARASASLISPVWDQDYHQGELPITERAMAILLSQRLLDADVEANRAIASLAAEWDRRATQAMRGQSQRHMPRTLTMKRPNRQ